SRHLMRAEADQVFGDTDTGLARAGTVITSRYTTSDRHANPIEPSATVTWWEGNQLTVHTSVQGIGLTQWVLAKAFGLSREDVRVICPFVGGGFGAKANVWPHLLLAAAAAKVAARPVRLELTRAQMYTLSGHQPASRQTVTLGATSDGRLTAIEH